VSLVLTLSAACKIGPSYEIDKANTIADNGNALNNEGAALLSDAADAYGKIYAEAQKSDDPFQELANRETSFKALEPKLATAKGKLADAAAKFDEAAKLKLPDWYKQYLTSLADQNRASSEIADLFIQVVKNTYDASIQDEKDLDAKQNALFDKIAAAKKRRDDLKATQEKIHTEHKDDFK
jgi:hypothetical protein